MINMRRFEPLDGSITSVKLADSAVISAKIATDAVDASKILAGAVGASELADAAVGSTKLADGAVSSLKLADAAVGTTKLADAAVSSLKLADAAVGTAKLADLAVSTLKLADNAVATAKLADGAVDLDTVKVGGALPAAKAVPALKTKPLIGDDNEVSSVGTTEVDQKSVRFAVSDTIRKLASIVCALEMKTSLATAAAQVKFYLDSEVTPRLTLSSLSLAYELQTGSFSISALAAGIHTITLKSSSAAVGQTAYFQLTEVHLVGG